MSISTTIQDVAAVATAGGFLAAAAALIQSRRLSKAENFFTLAQYLQSPEVRAARRHILEMHDDGSWPMKATDIKPPSAEQQHAFASAGLIASSYDLTGRVLSLGFVDQEPFLDDWGPSIKRMEGLLTPFVEMRRGQNHDARYLNDFQRLADDVRAWEKSRTAPRQLRRLAFRWERAKARRESHDR
jgi:hypothetical protein